LSSFTEEHSNPTPKDTNQGARRTRRAIIGKMSDTRISTTSDQTTGLIRPKSKVPRSAR